MKRKAKLRLISVLVLGALAMLVAASLGAFGAPLPSSTQAAYKPSQVDTLGTWLDDWLIQEGQSGFGLRTGRNDVLTEPAANAGVTGDGSPSQRFSPDGHDYAGLQLYVRNDGSDLSADEFIFENSGITMTGGTGGGTIAGDFRMHTPNTNSTYAGIYNALTTQVDGSRAFQVSVTITYNLEILSGGDSGMRATLQWLPNGTTVGNTQTAENAESHGTGVRVTLENITASNLSQNEATNNNGPKFSFRLQVPGGTRVKLSNVAVLVDVQMTVSNLNVAREVQYTVEGKNRETVSEENRITIPDGEVAEVFVKPDDVICLYTDVTYRMDTNSPYKNFRFPDEYASIFRRLDDKGQQSISNIVWSAGDGLDRITNDVNRFGNGQVLYTHDAINTVEEGAEQITGYSVYDGRKAAFRVNANAPGDFVEIKMYLPQSNIEGNERPDDAGVVRIRFKVDRSAPEAPKLRDDAYNANPNSYEARTNLLNAMEYQGYDQSGNPIYHYYTAGSSVALDMAVATYVAYTGGVNGVLDPATHQAREFVYAYVLQGGVDAGVFSLLAAARDLSPGHPGQTDFSYEYNNTTYSAVRQEIKSYYTYTAEGERVVNINPRQTPLQLERSPENGWALLMVRVDEAGNVSDPTLYSSGNTTDEFRHDIHVDSNRYSLTIRYMSNEETFSTNSMRNIANVFVAAPTGGGDDPYHDEQGRFKYPDAVDFSKEPVALSALGGGFTREVTIMSFVTVRIQMTTSQMNGFELERVRYYGAQDMDAHITPVRGDSNVAGTYQFTFQLTQAMVESNNLQITFQFRRVVDMDLSEDSFVFSGSRITLNDRVVVRNKSTHEDITSTLSGNANTLFNLTYHTLETVTLPAPPDTGYYAGDTVEVGGVQYVLISATPIGGEGNDYEAYRVDERARPGDGYIDAGDRYWVEGSINPLTENRYSGKLGKKFVIRKASPNVQELSIPDLVYGTSMADATFITRIQGMNGEPTHLTGEGGFHDEGLFLNNQPIYRTYLGVWGSFEITTPGAGDLAYDLPDVTRPSINVVVTFTPVNVTQYSDGTTVTSQTLQETAGERGSENSLLSPYYDYANGVYTLREGGLHAGNYEVQQLAVSLTVTPALATIEANGEGLVFDGWGKTPTVTTYIDGAPADLPYTIEYRPASGTDDDYTTQMPINAGTYIARFAVDRDDEDCNYYSDTQTLEFTIAPRPLTLAAGGSVPYVGDGTRNDPIYGVQYQEHWVWSYGQIRRLTELTATFAGAEGEPQSISVPYKYAFMQVRDSAHQNLPDLPGEAVFGEYYGQSDIPSDRLGIGTYLIHIVVDDTNNAGELIILGTITQVQADDGSGNLRVTHPGSLIPSYIAYNRDGSSGGYYAHLEFGEDLQENLNRITGGLGGATYRFANSSGFRTLTGRFYFEDVRSIAARNGAEAVLSPDGNYYLPVLYNEQGQCVDYSGVYLYWQATRVVDGEVVDDPNFAPVGRDYNLCVTPATADVEGVSLSPLTYGSRLDEASYVGTPQLKGGFVMQPGEYTLTPQPDASTVYPRGTHSVLTTLTPGEAWQDNVRAITFSAQLEVTALALDLTFDAIPSRAFGSALSDPMPNTGVDEAVRLRYVYYSAQQTAEGVWEKVDIITMGVDTRVGRYIVSIEVADENFTGSLESYYDVVPGKLVRVTDPAAPNISYGMSLGDVGENGLMGVGTCASEDYSILNITGTYAFLPEDWDVRPDVTAEGETVTFRIRFIPSAQYAGQFEELIVDFSFPVAKAEVVFAVSGDTQTYSGEALLPTVTATTPFEVEGEVRTVTLVYTCVTQDGQPPVDAGTYHIVYTVAEEDPYADRFTGTRDVTFTIARMDVSAAIKLAQEEADYTGEAIPPRAMVEGLEADLIFEYALANYAGSSIRDMVQVGSYLVDVSVDMDNYVGEARGLRFVILPARVAPSTLWMVYGSATDVTFDIAPAGIGYSVTYNRILDEGEDGESEGPALNAIQADTPAGRYRIHLIVEQNGLRREYRDFVLTIDRCPVTLSVNDTYTREYSGYLQTITVRATPVASLLMQYRLKDGGDEWQIYTATAGPTNAGTYDIRITSADDNYQVERTVTMTIRPAQLTLQAAPAFEPGQPQFGTPKDQVKFSTDRPGTVWFAAIGRSLASFGTWEFATGVDIEGLTAGVHAVDVVFTIQDHADLGILAANFEPMQATVNITIVPRDVSSYMEFYIPLEGDEKLKEGADRVLTTTYSQRGVLVQAEIRDEFFNEYPTAKGMATVLPLVLYNGSTHAPEAVGTYRLGVRLDGAANLTAAADNLATLRIEKATPVVTFVTFGEAHVGTPLGSVGISGGACIDGDESRPVVGDWQFEDPDMMLEHANEQLVTVRFVPANDANYNYVIFQATLFVEGDWKIEVEGVEASAITYGDPLQASRLTFTRAYVTIDGEQQEVEGELQWVEPGRRVHTSDSAGARFVPFSAQDRNTYTVPTLSFTCVPQLPAERDPKAYYLQVNKAEMVLATRADGTPDVTLFAFANSTLRDSLHVSATLVNSKYPDMKVTYTWEAFAADHGPALDDNLGSWSSNDAGAGIARVLVAVRFRNADYQDFEYGCAQSDDSWGASEEQYARVYEDVGSLIVAGAVEKYYDSAAISLQDLQLYIAREVGDTTSAAVPGYLRDLLQIACYNAAGDQVEAIESGSYTVRVWLQDNRYYADETFPFTIRKRNLSDAFRATGGSSAEVLAQNRYTDPSALPESGFVKVFGDSTAAPFGVAFIKPDGSDADLDLSSLVFTYTGVDGSVLYGTSMPQDAGEYIAHVQVSASNPCYEGSADFPLTILKRYTPVTMQANYRISYQQELVMTPTFANNNSIGNNDYYFAFSDVGSSVRRRVQPTDAGQYTVYAVIDHRNFYGEGTSLLTILQGTLTLEQAPTLGKLTFGQTFGEIYIENNGQVRNASGEPIAGVFRAARGEESPTSAGSNVTIAMCFEPYNTNYAVLNFDMDCVVDPATATFTIVRGEAIYNGELQLPSFNTEPLAGMRLNMTFRQGDTIVNRPINAGTYTVLVTPNDPNYSGSAEFTFIIRRAELIQVEAPTASNARVGESLLNGSSISGGRFVYRTDGAAIPGTLSFAQPGMIFERTGSYEVGYVFTPTGSEAANLLEYRGTLQVTIERAQLQILIDDVVNTYGTAVKLPKFSTATQSGLAYTYRYLDGPVPIPADYDPADPASDPIIGHVVPSGTYMYEVQINDDNYTGSRTFVITVQRKQLTAHFVNERGVQVNYYTTTYGRRLNARVTLDGVIADDQGRIDDILSALLFTYVGSDGYYALIPPEAVGDYEVIVTLDEANYVVFETRLSYSVARADIEKPSFDASSLNQTYGAVSQPIPIVARGVSYYVEYPGRGNIMPTSVGTWKVRIVINDPNYNPAQFEENFIIHPKPITIEDIVVSPKSYDGTPELQISGILNGVLMGDEVSLQMRARTLGSVCDPGTYEVDIYQYTLGGLAADNYTLRTPLYNGRATIYKRQVVAPGGNGYIVSEAGFATNVTVDIQEATTVKNGTNLASRLMGVQAMVQSFDIMENGLNTVLGTKVKVYIKIPEQMRNKKLSVEAVGDLANRGIRFTVEGDYVTFYTDCSGEIAFTATAFPYWLVIAGGALLIVVLGALLLFVFLPHRRRIRISRRAQGFIRTQTDRDRR